MTFTTFIKRPVLSTVISILIVLLGFIGLVSLPIEQYPDIAPPTVAVFTSYPGADAETVKNSVIVPLEESINGVEGMDYISSSAGAGSAQISVLFRQGMNADMCAVNVQNRVQQALALLPAEVTRIGVTVMKRQTSQVLMFTLTSKDGQHHPCHQTYSGCGRCSEPGSEDLFYAYLAEARRDETVQPDAF